MRDAVKTLFHPFDAGLLSAPEAGRRALFLAAEPGFRPPDDFSAEIVAIQGFRPLYLGLKRDGREVRSAPEGDGYDCALVLCGRHRGENELNTAEAVARTRPGGLIVIAGSKEDGVAPLRKRLEGRDATFSAAPASDTPRGLMSSANSSLTENAHPYRPVPIGGSVSKYHGVAFWLARTPEADGFANAARRWYGDRPLVDGRFRTAPGMFSYDRIDAGSRLLAEHLPSNLAGRVADFCAGWGYLAWEVRARCPQVRTIDLYEADFASLEAARSNMGGQAGPAIDFHWRDLIGEPVQERYDAIVMNPPFHTGRAAEPSLGLSLIASAAASLRKGGRLVIVANRGLPYAASLGQNFASHRILAEDSAFRVYEAIR